MRIIDSTQKDDEVKEGPSIMASGMEYTKADNEAENVTDPGASRHGNFMNYYQFHSAAERVRQLPHGVWRTSFPDRKYLALDVGCNAGDLTIELVNFLSSEVADREVSFLGVDLDPILIERAREQKPHSQDVTFESLDFLSDVRDSILTSYLKKLQRDRFDVAFCFSITMWIHLNHGDEGLVTFLRKVCDVCNLIVVEPQTWKSYRNASRRLRRANAGEFPLLEKLKYKGDMEAHVENIILERCGFRRVAVSAENDWQRKLLLFERNCET